MAQLLPRRVFPTLFIIPCLYLFSFTRAELSPWQCSYNMQTEYSGLYSGILQTSPNNPMSWCPLWAAVCSYIYRNCPSSAPCEFTNFDPSISVPYDPSSSTSYTNFLHCRSCDVRTNLDPGAQYFFAGILVPTQSSIGAVPTRSASYDENLYPGIPDGALLPGESPEDVHAESPSAGSATGAITAILVIGGVLGGIIAAKASGTNAASLTSPSGGPHPASAKTGGGSGQSAVDAVTLLLHFQTISTSGLLSLSYPALYRYFTFNFAWANLIIASDDLKGIARRLGTSSSCLSRIDSSHNDAYIPTAFTITGQRYDLDNATLGGLVYLSAIIGVAVALGVFLLVSVVLRILNAAFSNKLRTHVDVWPSKASSMSLRLFIWVLGSVAKFAIYQFAEPCSSGSLIAFAAVEFTFILLTLLTVSLLVIKIAQSQGPEALFPISDSEESRYSRKWGSLYSRLKRPLYWFFIPDYIWVLTKSIIVGAGQGSGISQVCALISVEVISLIALLVKRPYAASSANAFHIVSGCKRVFASASLFVFWDGFRIPTEIKRNIGIVLIFLESLYAGALFVVLLRNGSAAIARWRADRRERRRLSMAESTSGWTDGVPHLRHADSYVSGSTSPIQAKF